MRKARTCGAKVSSRAFAYDVEKGMLTKKDLEKLAEALAASRPPAEAPSPGMIPHLQAQDEQWVKVVDAICDALQELNPRFDRDTFTTYIQTGGYTSRR